jgi:hypothetical protein
VKKTHKESVKKNEKDYYKLSETLDGQIYNLFHLGFNISFLANAFGRTIQTPGMGQYGWVMSL